MLRDGRAAVRQREYSKILIRGVDVNGAAFEEITEVRDISEEGIYFYLNQPVWMTTYLTSEVISGSSFGFGRANRAMVVRIQTDASGKRLVAARFND